VHLPFTESQFLEVFASYNSAVWPVVVALWIATGWFSVVLFRGRTSAVALSVLAAVHWAWSGAAYHAIFFARINPAAWLFAALFLAQALAFIWLGVVRRGLAFGGARGPRRVLAVLFVVYALAYPVLVLAFGHRFPGAPAFAVPCPTTLWTAGLLLTAAKPAPRLLYVVPIVWSVVGGSAAWLLGMTPDLMLLAAAVIMTTYAARNR